MAPRAKNKRRPEVEALRSRIASRRARRSEDLDYRYSPLRLAQMKINSKNKKGQVTKSPRKESKIPSLRKYLAGDTTYQSQVNQLNLERQNYVDQYRQQRQDARQDYRTTLGRLNEAGEETQDRLSEDFASRGLFRSSMYADSAVDASDNLLEQQQDLTRDRGRVESDLMNSKNDFVRTVRNTRQNARQEAIRRRAEQYGIRR